MDAHHTVPSLRVCLRRILAGETLMRASMNHAFESYSLEGRTVDVGGGRAPNYHEYFQKGEQYVLEVLDVSISGIDFEKDPLPYVDVTISTAICANVLEHIFNHRFLLAEIHRILRKDGRLIGFVPFLVPYHPDPRDFFRYTKEALERLLQETGFREISVCEVGGGPFAANFNNIVLSVPIAIRLLLYPIYAFLDALFLVARPQAYVRYPLGYVFTVRK